MNLSVITACPLDFNPLISFPEPHSELSPDSVKAINAAKRALDPAKTDDFITDYTSFASLSSPDSIPALLDKFQNGLPLASFGESHLADLQTILDKLHIKTQHVLIHGIPVLHRLYYHIYALASLSDSSVGGDKWGEINALKDLPRLKKAFELTYLELATMNLENEVTYLFGALKEGVLTAHEHKRQLAIYRSLLLPNQNPALTSHISSSIDVSTPRRAAVLLRNITLRASSSLPLIFGNQPLSFLTGTNSYTLLGMFIAMQKGLSTELSLIPTGKLLASKIVPLAGELGDGIGKRGINLRRLSGCFASHYPNAFRYAKEKSFHFDSAASFDKVMSSIEWLPSREIDFKDGASLNRFKVALLRCLHYGNPTAEQKKHIKDQLQIWLERTTLESDTKSTLLSSLFSLIDSELPLSVPSEFSALLSKDAYPLVFGSTTLIEDDLMRLHGDISGECAFEGDLALGKDIQLAITDDAHVDEIQALVKEYKMHVLSFDVAEFAIRKKLSAMELANLEFMQ